MRVLAGESAVSGSTVIRRESHASMDRMSSSPLDLLEPGALVGGPLMRSLAAEIDRSERLPLGTRLGPFRITGELGKGGMGIVYRAQRDDGAYAQQVAIKCVQRMDDARRETLFLRERQILAELRHPHIARLLDGGRHESGRLWFAMECIEGERIDAHAIHQKLDVRSRISLMLQVIDAVSFAHQRLLIHRDIKPANVLVDSDGTVKLLDFGIASLVDDDHHEHAYSPAWASPEQRQQLQPGPASDQYQLGLLLNAVLSCQRSTEDVDEHTATAQWPSTTVGGQQISARHWCDVGNSVRRLELLAILARACAEQPDARYGSVAEFARDLQRWLDRRPVHAYAGGLRYALQCAVRRQPLTALAAGMALLVLILTVSAFSWRLAQERDLARLAAERAEREAATALAINQFLNEDLLQRANPYEEARRDLTVREALEQAAMTVDERFADQPAVAAALHWTLANSLLGVGEVERAETQMQQAIALDRARSLFDPAQRIQMQIDYADVYVEQRRFDEAAVLLGEAKSDAERLFGKDSELALQTEYRATQALFTSNRPEEFLDTNQRLLPKLAEGPRSLATQYLASLITDADAAARLGQFEHADESIALALARSQTLPAGEQHLHLAALQVSALLSRQRGDLPKAVEVQRQVAQLREQRFGRQHPVTLQALNELGSILQDAKQYAEAEALFREVLAAREQNLGVGNTLTRNSLNNLGLVLSLQGKLDEAGVHYRRALETERALLGDDALDVLILAHNFAGLLRAQGKWDEAIAMATDTVARAERSLSADRAEPALFRVGLAHALLKRGDKRAAIEQYELAHARLTAVYGADNPKVRRIEEMRDEALKSP